MDKFRPLRSRVFQFVQSGWPDLEQDVQFKPFQTRKDDLSVQDGRILWGIRVVIPKTGREDMVRKLHDGHPGEIRTKRLHVCLSGGLDWIMTFNKK